MPDSRHQSGADILQRRADGYLRVSDDYLRVLLLRPEIAPIVESCAAERRLHAALVETPRRRVDDSELASLASADARENYSLLLNFFRRLVAAETVEECYASLFRGDRPIDFPPVFVDELAAAIAGNLLHDVDDPFLARAGELLYREQTVQNIRGAVLLVDSETAERRRRITEQGNVNLLEMLHNPGVLGAAELDVLSAENGADYRARAAQFDFALDVTLGRPGLDALRRLFERWIRHFYAIEVAVEAVERIDDEHWTWHIGLDVEASALLNDLYNDVDIDEDRRSRLIALFRLEFRRPTDMRADIAGRPVYLALCSRPNRRLRLKPQNLIVNLPVATPA